MQSESELAPPRINTFANFSFEAFYPQTIQYIVCQQNQNAPYVVPNEAEKTNFPFWRSIVVWKAAIHYP